MDPTTTGSSPDVAAGGETDWAQMLASIAGMLGKNISEEHGTSNPFANIPGAMQQAQVGNMQMQNQQQLAKTFADMVGGQNNLTGAKVMPDGTVELKGTGMQEQMNKSAEGQLTGSSPFKAEITKAI